MSEHVSSLAIPVYMVHGHICRFDHGRLQVGDEIVLHGENYVVDEIGYHGFHEAIEHFHAVGVGNAQDTCPSCCGERLELPYRLNTCRRCDGLGTVPKELGRRK